MYLYKRKSYLADLFLIFSFFQSKVYQVEPKLNLFNMLIAQTHVKMNSWGQKWKSLMSGDTLIFKKICSVKYGRLNLNSNLSVQYVCQQISAQLIHCPYVFLTFLVQPKGKFRSSRNQSKSLVQKTFWTAAVLCLYADCTLVPLSIATEDKLTLNDCHIKAPPPCCSPRTLAAETEHLSSQWKKGVWGNFTFFFVSFKLNSKMSLT